MDFLHAVIRHTESDQLADAVVGNVPTDRAAALGQCLHDTRVGQRIDLQAAERTRDHHDRRVSNAQTVDAAHP